MPCKASKQTYLAAYSPKAAQATLESVRSLPDIWKARTPSLARMKNETSVEFVIDYLSLWIVEINELLNVSQKMNTAQIIYTARQLLLENPLLTIADVKLVCDRAVTGYYGKDYNRLDVSVICTWFRKHWEERVEAAEMESIAEHARTKQIDNTPRVGETEMEKQRKAFLHYLSQKK